LLLLFPKFLIYSERKKLPGSNYIPWKRTEAQRKTTGDYYYLRKAKRHIFGFLFRLKSLKKTV